MTYISEDSTISFISGLGTTFFYFCLDNIDFEVELTEVSPFNFSSFKSSMKLTS